MPTIHVPKGLSVVLIAAMVALGMALVVPAEAIATAGKLKANPSALVAGEKLVLSGSTTPRLKRPVILQRKSGSSWIKVAKRSSAATGAFSFTTTGRGTTTVYRVYAPAATIGGKKRAAVTTPTRKVTTLTQKASLTLPATAVLGGTSAARAAFTPVRAGRPVTLELLKAGAVWSPYGATFESATGTATFRVAHDATGTFRFRVVARAWKGAAKVMSSPHTIVIDAPNDTTPPGPVTSVTVTGATSSSLTLGWINPDDGDFAGVMIRRSVGSAPPTGPTSGALVSNLGAGATSHVDSGLAAGTTYSYALFARDEVPNYAPAATGQGTTTTPGDTTPPGPVTSVTVTGATSSSLTLGWVNPDDGDFAGVMIRRSVGSAPPTGPTSGALVSNLGAGATSHVDSGLAAGTTYSYALFARDEVPNYAPAATGQGTTGATTTADWGQARHDAEHRGWSPGETAITPANASGVGEEWNVEGGGTPVIAGGVAYVLSASTLNGAGLLTAYQLATGERLWRISTDSCSAGPVAVTVDLVVLGCSSSPRAYARGGAHDLVWDTQEAEQGQAGLQNLLIVGDRVVAWGSTRIASYQLSNGDRAWNLLLPSGADTLQDVAATGSTVVVAYNDRLRALALSNGAQQWSNPGVVTAQLVIADGWIYTSNETSFGRFALASGAAGWSKPATFSFGRVEAVDGDTVYVWDPQFDFGPPSPSVLRALSTSDGSLRWEYDVPSRVGSVAVTGGLLWLTSTDIYSQGRNGNLIALNRATGAEVRNLHFEDNIYGWTDVAFGAGKVVLHQGGSFGGSTPHTLRVFGLAGPVPMVATKVLPIGRVGSSYSFDLESTSATATWSLHSGSLPGGLTLTGTGKLMGTPTTVGSGRMTLRATAPNGRTDDRAFTLQVVPAASSGGWSTTARDASGNPFDAGTGQLELEDAPTISYRWKTAAPGASVTGNLLDVVASGTRMYGVPWDGFLKAWDTTGSTANRAPVWAVKPDDASFTGGATIAGNRILVRDDSGHVYARDLATGGPVWRTTDSPGMPFGDEGPMVVGSTVVVRDGANSVRAYSLTTGAPLWGGEAAPVTNVYRPVSSDGTRIFAVGQCQLSALSLVTGAVLWQIPMSERSNECGLPGNFQGPPVVVDGRVHATETGVRVIATAATGAVQQRFTSSGYWGHTGVVVGGVWIYLEGEELVAVDTSSGDLLWRIPGDWRGARLSATGDLILVATGYNLLGFSRLTGEQVWDGGSISASRGTAVIHGDRILMATQDSIRAYGPP